LNKKEKKKTRDSKRKKDLIKGKDAETY